MKYLPLFIIFYSMSCTEKSPTDRLQDEIKIHLSKTMHDFKSYEPVDYSKVDSTFTVYASTPRGKGLYDSLRRCTVLQERFTENARSYTYTAPETAMKLLSDSKRYGQVGDSLLAVINKEEKEYRGVFNGYKIVHSFRGKNMSGATVLSKKRFSFDTAYKLIDAQDVK